jgi:hypothetical protein
MVREPVGLVVLAVLVVPMVPMDWNALAGRAQVAGEMALPRTLSPLRVTQPPNGKARIENPITAALGVKSPPAILINARM